MALVEHALPHTLERAPHLWQVGLDPMGGRVCDTLVCPVGGHVIPKLLRTLSTLAGCKMQTIPEHGYAHVTIHVSEYSKYRRAYGSRGISVLFVVDRLEATEYSIRAIGRPIQQLPAIAASFGISEPACAPVPYITLAYALHPLPTPDLRATSHLVRGCVLGALSVVQHRRMDEDCAAFMPNIVRSWAL